jgi:hypothetical protein
LAVSAWFFLKSPKWFRTTAKAKFYDTDVVRNFFFKHNAKCTKMAKEFKMTVFDCVKAEM